MARITAAGQSDQPNVEDRITEFETKIICYERYNSAWNAISALHRRYRQPGSDQKLKAQALLIVGQSGSGKSTICDRYATAHPHVTLEDVERDTGLRCTLTDLQLERLRFGDLMRVVKVEAPDTPTKRSLVAAILSAFGYEARERWNAEDIIEKIVFLCRETFVELIIIDESSNLLRQRNPDIAFEIAEFIKSLLNRLKVNIVLAGLPSLLTLGEYHHITGNQMNRRLAPPIILSPPNWNTLAGRVSFLAVLQLFEQNLNLPQSSNLHDMNIAQRLYVVSGGEIGFVSKYLSKALELTLRRNLKKITSATLAEVYDGFNPQTLAGDGTLDFTITVDELKNRDLNSGSDENHNPFRCTPSRLNHLWNIEAAKRLQMGMGTVGNEIKNDGSRKTRLRATGRKLYTGLGPPT